MVTNTTATTELVESGEKRDTLGRRHTPAERRAELLAAYRASGLTQSAFAQREGSLCKFHFSILYRELPAYRVDRPL